MNRKRMLLPLALLSLVVSAALEAAIFIKAPDEYLVDQAPVIVRAMVSPLASPPTRSGPPVTHYRLEVTAGLRGAIAGEILEIAVPGGRDAAGRTMILSGAPAFAEGEEALFFLDRDEGGPLRPFFLEQGVYRLGRIDGKRTSWRRLGDGALAADGVAEPEQPRDLASFERWIADRVAGIKRPADYFIAQPAGPFEAAASPYTLLGEMRWPKSTGRLDISYLAHERPQPGIAGGGYAELREVLDNWTQLPDGLLNLRYGGTTSSTNGFRSNDGINSVVFDNYGEAYPGVRPFDCAAQVGYLGYARLWIGPEFHYYAGRQFSTIVHADAITNDDFDCFSGFNSANFGYLLAHEIGHTLGLGHACEFNDCGSPEEAASVMHNRSPDNSGPGLSEDDRRAIAYLYGPPKAPSYLSAEAAGEGRVELRWEDASDNESGFAIYRQRGGQLERIGFTGVGTSSFDDEDAEPGTTYVYKVRAENENGASAAVEASVTTVAPNFPNQLAAIEAGADFLRLTWVDRASGETGYEVWGGFAGPDQLLVSLPANSNTVRVEGLIADTVYQLKVRAVGLPTGNTAFSSTVAAGTRPAPVEPCVDGAAVACLAAERFKVEVRWKDFAGNRGQGALAPAGSADSGVFYFFSPNNWEMLVKVLDGCAINGKTWVFAAATTDVETTLIVTDSQTGNTAVYFNQLGQASTAVTDIAAFQGCAGGQSAPTRATGAAPLCGDGSGDLCLLGGRFRVKVAWTDFGGQQGQGRAVPAGTSDSGLFYFFSPDNWEMLVKVLDGCAINGQVWVFAAGTTNVAYTLEVEDRETGLVKSYENLLGQPSAAIADIAAFDVCPL